MAGLSIWHIILFAIVLILLFGTAKLKNMGKDLGGAVKDFKDSVKDEDAKKQQELNQQQSRLNDERVIDARQQDYRQDRQNSHLNADMNNTPADPAHSHDQRS